MNGVNVGSSSRPKLHSATRRAGDVDADAAGVGATRLRGGRQARRTSEPDAPARAIRTQWRSGGAGLRSIAGARGGASGRWAAAMAVDACGDPAAPRAHTLRRKLPRFIPVFRPTSGP
eukprot:357618-Chlamydomonas_euryale.AAC.3